MGFANTMPRNHWLCDGAASVFFLEGNWVCYSMLTSRPSWLEARSGCMQAFLLTFILQDCSVVASEEVL